jgi:hypothetical protein
MIWTQAGVVGGVLILLGGPVTVFSAVAGHAWPLFGIFLPFTAWGLLILVAGFRAGLGICRDGVLIRQMWFPGVRWVPWTEIQRFDVVPKNDRGGKWMSIVVVLADRKPLPVDACSSYGWEIPTMLGALENERISASHHEPPGQPHLRLYRLAAGEADRWLP